MYEDYFVSFLINKRSFLFAFQTNFCHHEWTAREEGRPLSRIYAGVQLLHISANAAEGFWSFSVAGSPCSNEMTKHIGMKMPLCISGLQHMQKSVVLYPLLAVDISHRTLSCFQLKQLRTAEVKIVTESADVRWYSAKKREKKDHRIAWMEKIVRSSSPTIN